MSWLVSLAFGVLFAGCGGNDDDSSCGSSSGGAATTAATQAPVATIAPQPSATPSPILVDSHQATPQQLARAARDARTSQLPQTGGAGGVAVYDDFVIPGATTITKLSWQGIYCAAVQDAPSPPATAVSFVVSFYTDYNGSPASRTRLATATYPIAQTNQAKFASVPNYE